ncbi:MAG: hypothetical protein WCF27_05120 [Gaiellaceae bacterium]
MAVRGEKPGTVLAEGGLDALVEAVVGLGTADSLAVAMQILAEATAVAAGADVVVARVADEQRRALVTCAVVTGSAAVAAELQGSRLPLGSLPRGEATSED